MTVATRNENKEFKGPSSSCGFNAKGNSMRTFIFGMMALLGTSAFSRADVVFSNTNVTGLSTDTAAFTLNFNVTTSGSSITAFKLFSTDQGTSKSVSFQLDSGTASVISANFLTDGYSFDLSTLAGANNISSGSSHTLALTAIGLTYATTNASTITNNPVYGFYNTSYAGSPSNVARFEVVGVPEPGTLLLGGIAAITGSGGVWWKRRRKCAGNSAATETAVN